MRDKLGRTIDYMRISITDRCNLRCKYCMPEGIELIPTSDILTFEEIVTVCREAVTLGVRKFKITGGEPLVRKGCPELIRNISRIAGVEQVTMTTNGILLKKNLEALLDAGLNAVNISLDTLNRDKFQEITGFDELDEVLTSIDAAMESGLKVKINSVLQPGLNATEWQELLELAKKKKIDVRFIEMMPIGDGKQCSPVSNQEIFRKIEQAYPDVEKDGEIHGNGPAVYYRIPGFMGSVGFISAIHGAFCNKCNRIRMTATGELKPCLCYQDSLSVREAVRTGRTDEVGDIIRRAILMKPERHCFEQKKDVTESRKMVQIGG